MSGVRRSIAELGPFRGNRHILLTDEIHPALLGHPKKLEQIKTRLRRAAEAITSNKGDIAEKQRLLDVARKVRRKTTKRGTEDTQNETVSAEVHDRNQKLNAAVKHWSLGTTLLGSGAEHLEKSVKRALASDLLALATSIIDVWTRDNASVDFARIKEDFMSPEGLEAFKMELSQPIDDKELKRIVSNLVDRVEYSYLAEPFRRVLHHLCEQARHKALGISILNATVDGQVESVLHGAWLADIDTTVGKPKLKKSIANLPQAAFFRFNLASHLFTRMFWSHAKPEDKMVLLDLAQGAVEALNLTFDKAKFQRLIGQDDGKKGSR